MAKLKLVPIVRDWEERISQFLRAAIEQPHMEPEICEDLLEYIMYLVAEDRRARLDNLKRSLNTPEEYR